MRMEKIITYTKPETLFATLAIGATAKKMGITATELYNRLKHYGLVQRLLFDCYDTLHSESIDGVVWNVTEALKNWEAKEGVKR
jgi:hypothetical protein